MPQSSALCLLTCKPYTALVSLLEVDCRCRPFDGQVPVAIGGPGLPKEAKFRSDLRDAGLTNVTGAILNLLGFQVGGSDRTGSGMASPPLGALCCHATASSPLPPVATRAWQVLTARCCMVA